MEKHPSQRPDRNQRPDTTDLPMFEPEFVTFKVGREEKIFEVHKGHACYYVPVFRVAFNNKTCIEGETQIYTIKHTTPDVFRLLIRWLYTQSLVGPLWKVPRPLPKFENAEERIKAYEQQRGAVDQDFIDIIRLWLLADYLLLPKLQNLAMDELCRLYNAFRCDITIGTLQFIWDETAEESPLRKYFAAWYARVHDFDVSAPVLKQLTRNDILVDLLVAMQQFRMILPQANFYMKSYHVPLLED